MRKYLPIFVHNWKLGIHWNPMIHIGIQLFLLFHNYKYVQYSLLDIPYQINDNILLSLMGTVSAKLLWNVQWLSFVVTIIMI